MKKIFCFGNEFVREDSLAKELCSEINRVNGLKIINCASPDSLIHYDNLENTIIIDVIKGIDKVILITDLNQLKRNSPTSAHDIDLGFYLKLYKEIGRIKDVKIIGIPQSGDKESIKKQLIMLLKRMI